jgi:LDH2 family malate/lactate/ureidoglycolate dehydrogenase
MVPMGGHKGYGLAVFTEVLAAALSGAAMTTSVLPWLLVHDRPTDVGHAFIAIDPERFMARREFEVRVDELVERLQGTDRAPGVERIYVPGELEHEREATALVHGLPLRPVVWQHLRDAARRVGLTGELSRLRAGAPA